MCYELAVKARRIKFHDLCKCMRITRIRVDNATLMHHVLFNDSYSACWIRLVVDRTRNYAYNRLLQIVRWFHRPTDRPTARLLRVRVFANPLIPNRSSSQRRQSSRNDRLVCLWTVTN